MDDVPVPGVVVAPVPEGLIVAAAAAGDSTAGDAVGEAFRMDVQPTSADTATRVRSATTFRTAMSAGYVRPPRSRPRLTNT
jgi:hypothetical protein